MCPLAGLPPRPPHPARAAILRGLIQPCPFESRDFPLSISRIFLPSALGFTDLPSPAMKPILLANEQDRPFLLAPAPLGTLSRQGLATTNQQSSHELEKKEGVIMDKRAWRTMRAVALVFLLIGVLVSLPSQRAEATHGTFAAGDVFVSMSDGTVQWFHSDGTFNRVLPTLVGGHAEGMAFDASANLFVTHRSPGNTVETFNPSGVRLGTFGSGYNCNPNSIVFGAGGNAYVGQADCSADVLKFDSAGNPLDAFDVAAELRGSNWIDLAADGCTIYYTSDGTNVLRYNACARAQLSNFNSMPLPGSPPPLGMGAGALRILPDGRVLVADYEVIVLLDASGNEIQRYDVLGEPEGWRGVDIVGDGTFWASNFSSGNVYKFEINTGTVLATFNAGPANTVKAVAVRRAPTAVFARGRMTGGGSIFTSLADSGVPPSTRVTHGFELHCDPARKPNNLEINIHTVPGSRFHLESLTFALCTDDPTITPNPPAAPFDTYEGKGTGSYNGQSGATAEWIFTDAGEPGVNDRIKKLIIRDAGGNVVLNIPEPGHPLTYGNHQAHK